MTADPVAAATNGSPTPAAGAVPGSGGPVGSPPQLDSSSYGSLVEPQVLYAATAQAAGNTVVAQRLNERLDDELHRLIGSVTDPLGQAVRAAARGVRWQDARDRTVAELAAAELTQAAADPRLAGEAGTARAHVLTSPSRKVADVLGLDTPVIDNPAMHTDVTHGLVVEFARLAGLGDVATQAVTQHSEALVNTSAATLAALVQQGRLTTAEQTSLATILDLAKLTDDNLVLIRALLATSVTSPLSLVGWTVDHWQQLISAQQMPVPPGDTATSYAETIVHNLETTYPAHALAAHGADGHLATLLAKNPHLDVRSADLVGGAAAQFDWSGIPVPDRPKVENELRTYQRLIPLADSTADRLALKRVGYDSAMAIANAPEEEFVRNSGIDEGRARLIHARAHSAAASVAQHHAAVHHLVKNGFANLPVGNVAALADELRQVEGMNELFGSQDYCDCDDCHSVLSPAAYFVDLMWFLETFVSRKHFTGPKGAEHPLHLRHRRPDLWKLELTPQNTNTLIPYLTIVNEVLETYLDHAGHRDIYRTLSDPSVKVSFRVPFSQPFTELGLYLAHFNLTPADIHRVLGHPAAQLHRAQLGLSRSEATVITSPDPAGVLTRLGHSGEHGDHHLPDFLRATGLQRDQLDALLASRFHPDLRAVTVTDQPTPGELQNFPQILTNLTPARVDFIHRFIRLWRATSWQIAELDLILAAGAEAKLIGHELDDRTIEFVARMTSLQKSLRLQPEELCALVADMPVSADYPRPPAPGQQRLYERVFDPAKLFASVTTNGDSPADAQPEPPSVLQPMHAHAAPDGAFHQQPAPPHKTAPTEGQQRSWAFHLAVAHTVPQTAPLHHSSFNTADPNDARTDPRAPMLLSSLGISEADFEALLALLGEELGFDAHGDSQIDRHRLSLMYRHARLAGALDLAVADLAAALSVLFHPAERVMTTLDPIEQLVAFITWQRASAFSVAELRFILSGATDGPITFTRTDQSTALLVQQAQAAHAADPRDALRDKLAVAFNVPAARLLDLLAWIPADINGPAIRAAAATVIAADGTPATPGDLVPLTDLAQQLERVILLFTKLKIDDANLSYLTHNRDLLGITSATALTLRDVRAIAFYSAMIAGDTAAPAATQAFLTELASGSRSAVADRRIADLWHVGHGLPGALRKVLPAARTPIDGLQDIHDAATMCTTLGVSAYALASLGNDASFGELSHARDIALGAVTAKYPDASKRDQTLAPLHDRVNVLKRDALCDYIMGWGAALNFHSHSDLYDFFLIDPDMGSCFQTSRVVSALSTLQLYAERCRQGLEQTRRDAPKNVAHVSIPPGAIPGDQWEWRKNFRVWQANRKVFLHPESYIDPDLLDIKTPLFEDLEDELLQQKITMDSASDAYLRYLTQFAELANLRIAGSCYRAETNTYYFFGCTHQDPPVYYWRSWDETTWSPWRKIELAINALTVSAEFHLGRLYLFWVDTKTKDKTSIQGGNSQLEYYEASISLQYSALQPNGKWLPVQKLDSLRPLQAKPGIWNNRLYPPTDSAAALTEAKDLAQAGVNVAVDLAGITMVQALEAPKVTELTAAAKAALNPIAADLTALILQQMEDAKTYRRVYPDKVGDSMVLRYINGYLQPPAITDRELDLFHNKLRSSRQHLPSMRAAPAVLLIPDGQSARLGITTAAYPSEPEFDLALEQLPLTILKPAPKVHPHIYLTEKFPHHPPAADEARADHILNLVHNRYPESIFTFGEQHYLIHEIPTAHAHGALLHGGHHPSTGHAAAVAHQAAGHRGAHPATHSAAHQAGHSAARTTAHRATAHHAAHATSIAHTAQAHTGSIRRQLVRLSTSTADHLGETLMKNDGLNKLFSLDTQKTKEKPVGFKITTPAELSYPADNPHHLDFDGAMGTYLREIYLHIPWLIARALRADGKYQDALAWYSRICDFTAEDSKHDTKPADRPWRYIEFREQTVPKLKAVLTDKAAIAAYDTEPFNPHAIARLRPSAYQRAMVMDIVGTLHDLGDSLFVQDTMESVNEASLHYSRAAEILGPRPARLGRCHTVPDSELTYDKLGPAVGKGSELLVMLENWAYANHAATAHPGHHPTLVHVPQMHAPTGHPGQATTAVPQAASSIARPISARPAVAPYLSAAAGHAQRTALATAVKNKDVAVPKRHAPAVAPIMHGTLAFCIPPNEELLKLYDDVEDRLFKIRNCMNISGVRRQLALFAPPIDVMALVRARAAGLSLEDALAALEAPVPPYRFTHLIDRARQAASTAQAFGSALLSALEKKDAEELTLLRSLHERQVLRMTKDVKTKQLQEAQHQAQAMAETETNVQNRIDHYNDLISGGLNGPENAEQISQHTASIARGTVSTVQLAAAIVHLAPQIGSFFAMKWGGKEMGDSARDMAAVAESTAAIANDIAASAALTASFQRREQEWRHNLLQAQQELKQVQEQHLAADIRAAIAERELDIHQISIDRAAELDDFYKNKFSRLGLYNYLATTLTRLHHTAYHVAEELAKMTQRAYQFERNDDNTVFIAPDNWQADQAGLLAGERLTLQLQQLENAYLAKNTRQLDVTQTFSLALVDPHALLQLRETGSCEFTLPEVLFDLANPGHYKRTITAVRLTIPAVTGPNTNLGATLTLKSSSIRSTPSSDAGALHPGSATPADHIAISTGINDQGIADPSDGRYLPFEGAGAISTWGLTMPSKLRLFDYNTIPDVLIQLSFRALDDGAFRDAVESALLEKLTSYATNPGLHRLFSLRHEFPDAYAKLRTTTGSKQTTQIDIAATHFPYFLSSQKLSAGTMTIMLRPKGTDPIDTNGLSVTVNGAHSSTWTTLPNTNLPSTDIAVSGAAVNTWKMEITSGRLDPAKLDDVLILLKYKLQ